MALKTILFSVGFIFFAGGALVAPHLGIIGYVLHYNLGPERQWWFASLRHLDIRYSYMLALLTAIGMVLNWRKLRFGKSILIGHEKLLLLLLGLVWLSVAIGGTTLGRYTIVDHPSVKFTKIVVFVLLLTHVITNLPRLDALLWVLVVGALLLGLKAYDLPRSAFISGRLDTVGGPDFREANYFAAYAACVLPIIAGQFMRSKWPGRILCLLAGAFVTNAIILTRSRGAVVGLVAAAIAVVSFSPKRHRVKLIAGLVIAGFGIFYLGDPQFFHRAGTITDTEEERDTSAQSRFELWRAASKMIAEHPAGVGAGNFYQNVGNYNSELTGKDAHNTYVRCCAELGIQGCAVFILIILNAFRTLRSVRKRSENLPPGQRDSVNFLAFSLTTSLVTLLACCITMSLTYVEYLWWFLALPVCLTRALENREIDLEPSPAEVAATPGKHLKRARLANQNQARARDQAVKKSIF